MLREDLSSPLDVRIEGKGLAEWTGSPPELVLPARGTAVAHQVRASIQNQFFVAADQGRVSKIRAWRIMRGLDQTTLALRTNMSQPEISRAERLGQVNRMKGDTLRRIAQALQVRIDDLF